MGADAADINEGDEIALVKDGETFATMKVEEKYVIDREFECKHVYTTTDLEHPGVKMVMAQEAVNLAGPVKVLTESFFPKEFPGLYQRPAEARKMFEEKGWSRVAALQLRNPMHRSHEYLAKIAIEVCDGVYIHQLLGKLKAGDIPAEVRVYDHRGRPAPGVPVVEVSSPSAVPSFSDEEGRVRVQIPSSGQWIIFAVTDDAIARSRGSSVADEAIEDRLRRVHLDAVPGETVNIQTMNLVSFGFDAQPVDTAACAYSNHSSARNGRWNHMA